MECQQRKLYSMKLRAKIANAQPLDQYSLNAGLNAAATIQNKFASSKLPTETSNIIISDQMANEDHCYVRQPVYDNYYLKAQEIIKGGERDCFAVVSMDAVLNRLNLWKSLLPEVDVFYAVKSNPNPEILKTLFNAGTSFDCASSAEIQTMLDIGAKPSQLILAHACKDEGQIAFAREKGVKLMTFDCIEEAEKIGEVYPEAELVLRIAVEKTDAPCPMTNKFGAPKSSWNQILDTCQSLGIRVRGVSFHVGSGGSSFMAYSESIKNACTIFQMAREKGMEELDLIDIGGGFTMNGRSPMNNFDNVAPQISQLLRSVKNKNVRFIAEPGRFFCQEAYATAVRIYLARQMDNCRHYFINSGVYQAFQTRIVEDEKLLGQPMLSAEEIESRVRSQQKSYIWGQTCDGVDWIAKDSLFPLMQKDEWIIYRDVGAYNLQSASTFNGFSLPKIYQI